MKKTMISTVMGFLCPGFYGGIFKILIFFLLTQALSANRASAQVSGLAPHLSVGQALPDVLLNTKLPVLGRDTAAFVLLSALKGKPFILDFWATWCGSCIASLPHVDSIYRAYAARLPIFLVNASLRDRDWDKVGRFVDAYLKENVRFSVPFLARHDLFATYFKFQLLPYYVWIGADGRVKAMTGYKSLTDESVRQFLRSESVSIHSGGL